MDIKTCFNCTHHEVCKHCDRLKEAFVGFPFIEDPEHQDSDYLINMEFSDMEYAIAMCCEEFTLRTVNHIKTEQHCMFKSRGK